MRSRPHLIQEDSGGEKGFELCRTEVGENFPGPVEDRCFRLAGQAHHFGAFGGVGRNNPFVVIDPVAIKDLAGLGAPWAVNLGIENRTGVGAGIDGGGDRGFHCLLYTSPSPRD